MSIRLKRMVMLKHLSAALFALLLGVFPPLLIAGPWTPNASSTPAPILVAQRAVSMSEAIDLVRRSTGGRILDAQDAGNYYRIKVLTRDGEVQIIRVDARTGSIQ